MSDQDDARQKLLSDPVYQKILIEKHWKQQGQPWRAEPEIDAERQKYLGARRYKVIKEGKLFFPLKDVSLSRADIEWLLATHESGRGPIDWNDLEQCDRQGLDLSGVDLRGVDLSKLPLANADLSNAYLENANLSDTHLQNANFVRAYLENADLSRAHLERTKLMNAELEGASLSSSFLDSETDLNSVTLYSQEKGGVILADVRWGDVNVAVVDWSTLSTLGDEAGADQYRNDDKTLEQVLRLEFLRRATRAYRQLAIVLRNQGLNDEANRFAYRAQLMQRIVYKRQKSIGNITAYFIIGHTAGPALSPLSSVVFSMTSFHGRGFFPGGITLDDPLTVLAALEAFVGLLIEVTFIATLTRRLFGG